ncbi:hypothetical protein PInf_010178 [Phytophthora infestans]|nr:hypothetical protein PInf_010178 [Phytophthora infestans]
MAEKERSAEEARRADIARPFTADLEDDGEEGKSAEDNTEEQADDAKAAETAGEETMNGSDSSGVSEEDVAQTQVAEEPSERRRQGRKMTVSDIEDEVLTEVPAFKAQHNYWASLMVSLKEYMEATRQKIVVKEVINIARRNAHLRSQVR